MGGTVSAGVDNDDLVDNLLAAFFIKTPSVERVFRAVDRGMYFPPLGRESAYKDVAWKGGNIHLSAPCLYCEVMETLNLSPGMSFLNLGSGTGYLSTMAGLLLGSLGTNHGVEIHHDVVQYAQEKLEEFKKTAAAIDENDFCEPKFVQGDCLQLDSCSQKYDRVYCGAACPQSYENYMKNLLKVGGILVLPMNEILLKITRVSETVWETKSLLPVAFANLLEPSSSPVVILPNAEPISLMETCRTTIRVILQAAVDKEHPELKVQLPPKVKSRKERTLQRLFIPMLGESESLSIITGYGMDMDGFFEGDSDDNMSSSARSSNDSDDPSDSSSSSFTRMYQARRALFRAMRSYDMGTLNIPSTEPPDPAQVSATSSEIPPQLDVPEYDAASSGSSIPNNDSSDTSMDVDQSGLEKSGTILTKLKTKRIEGTTKRGRNKRKEVEMEESDSPSQSSNSTRRSFQACGTSTGRNKNRQLCEGNQTHSSKKKSGAKREKVDSGIGEDINNQDISPSDVGWDLDMASDSDSEDDGNVVHKSAEKLTILHGRRRRNGKKDRKGGSPSQERRQPEVNLYVLFMRSKIQQLPLPPCMKSFINHHREL